MLAQARSCPASPLCLANSAQPPSRCSLPCKTVPTGWKACQRMGWSPGSSLFGHAPSATCSAAAASTSTSSSCVSHCSPRRERSIGIPGRRSQLSKNLEQQAVHRLSPCQAWTGARVLDDEMRAPVPKYQHIVGVAAGALLLCNLHRSTFSVLLPELGQRLGLSPSQAGLINAAMLATYLAGQIPAGHLADVYGGMRVLLWGLALWSVGIAATAYAPTCGDPLAALLLSRACVGLASAGIMPCIAAMSSKFVPMKDRGRTIAIVWSLFNFGGVIGLALAPLVSAAVGVGPAFQAAGALGLLWAAAGGLYLAYLEPEPLPAAIAVELSRSTGFTTNSRSSSRSKSMNDIGAFGMGGSANRGSGSTSSSSSGFLGADPGSSSGAWGSNARKGFSSGSGKDASSSPFGGSSSNSSQPSRPINSIFPNPFSEWGLPKPPWEWFQQQQGMEPLQQQSWQQQQQQTRKQQQQDKQQQAQMLPLLQQQQQLLQQQQEVLRQEMLLQQQQQKQKQPATADGVYISREGWREIGVLCMAHAVIGAGFFILQAWAPTYIASLGQQNLEVTGFLSSLPWLAAAAVGMVAGAVADRLISRKPWQASQPSNATFGRATTSAAAADAAAALSQRLFVRRLMQSISFLGCAASALPLAVNPTPGLALAISCLTANCAFYACSYGGFHAHLQDVAGPFAGKVQGASNTCSIAMGVAGTLATGVVLERTGSYTAVFGVLAALYVAATVLWDALITGKPIFQDASAPRLRS